MNIMGMLRARKRLLLVTLPKGLLFYVAIPFLILRFLAGPIGDAVRRSDAAAFWILLAALGAVVLNWGIYAIIHRKCPSLLVLAHGALCMMVVTMIEHEALPGYEALAPTLATIGGYFAMASMILMSYWFAARKSRPAHVMAVGLWIVIGAILCAMAYRIFRDIECRIVSLDTWITLGSLIVFLLGLFTPHLCSALRRNARRRRASAVAEGRIVQIIGETSLDLDDDPVVSQVARVQFTVNDTVYETRAKISEFLIRKYGKEPFIGQKLPVAYDPADPSSAYPNQIDRHVLEARPEDSSRETEATIVE